MILNIVTSPGGADGSSSFVMIADEAGGADGVDGVDGADSVVVDDVVDGYVNGYDGGRYPDDEYCCVVEYEGVK